jgi:hypothetical protein
MVPRKTGGTMPNNRPKQPTGVRLDTGILREAQWAALVRLWQAGDMGIPIEELRYGRGGFTWDPTLVRLARYITGPLMEYYKPVQAAAPATYRISGAGRQFYREQWSFYRERYPELEAPEPNDT